MGWRVGQLSYPVRHFGDRDGVEQVAQVQLDAEVALQGGTDADGHEGVEAEVGQCRGGGDTGRWMAGDAGDVVADAGGHRVFGGRDRLGPTVGGRRCGDGSSAVGPPVPDVPPARCGEVDDPAARQREVQSRRVQGPQPPRNAADPSASRRSVPTLRAPDTLSAMDLARTGCGEISTKAV